MGHPMDFLMRSWAKGFGFKVVDIAVCRDLNSRKSGAVFGGGGAPTTG